MSKIEWTTETWNPVGGCSLVSPGCSNCYAMKQAARIVNMYPGSHYAGTVQGINGRHPTWTGKLVVAPDHIFDKPLKRRKPTLYFVNSMSDLFHEGVDDATIDRVFAIMALRHDHRFQILTKRHERMRSYMTATDLRHRLAEAVMDVCPIGFHIAHLDLTIGRGPSDLAALPLKNVWLGVSVEDQRRANERIPALGETPVAVRFISVEPQLGPVDLREVPCPPGAPGIPIDWIICGGESGPGARLFNLAWARSLRDQCAERRIAFFMKQTGSHAVYNLGNSTPSFRTKHSKGGNMEEWPEDLRVREFPE